MPGLAEYLQDPQLLGGAAPLPNIMAREMRTPPLGQGNLVDRALSSFGQPSLDALRQGMAGKATPQEVARTFLETGPVGPFGAVRTPNPIRAYHGSGDPNLQSFSPQVAGGSRNTGGQGAVFLTPYEREARGAYGPHLYEVQSSHQRPFIWDARDIPGTLQRAREVMPDIQERAGVWLDQPAFFDALKRARYDAVETRGPLGPTEWAVLNPEIIEILRKYGMAGPVAAPAVATGLSDYLQSSPQN